MSCSSSEIPQKMASSLSRLNSASVLSFFPSFPFLLLFPSFLSFFSFFPGGIPLLFFHSGHIFRLALLIMTDLANGVDAQEFSRAIEHEQR
eukprot:SAG31_NODE_27877_length_418_cov_6.257053_1_plen_90_part_01